MEVQSFHSTNFSSCQREVNLSKGCGDFFFICESKSWYCGCLLINRAPCYIPSCNFIDYGRSISRRNLQVVPDEENEFGQDYWQALFERNQKTTAAPSISPSTSFPTILPSPSPGKTFSTIRRLLSETLNADPMAYATPTNLTDSDTGMDMNLPLGLSPAAIGAGLGGLCIFCICCCFCLCLILESIFVDDEPKTIYVDETVGEVYSPEENSQEDEGAEEEVATKKTSPNAPPPKPSSPTGNMYPYGPAPGPYPPGYPPPGPHGHYPGYYPPPGYYGPWPGPHQPHQRGRGRGRRGRGRGRKNAPPGQTPQRNRQHSNRTKENPPRPGAKTPHRQTDARTSSDLRAQQVQGKNRVAQRKKSNRTTANPSPPGKQPPDQRNQPPRKAITEELINPTPNRGNATRGASVHAPTPRTNNPISPTSRNRNSLANNRKNSTRRTNPQGAASNRLQAKQPQNGASNRPASIRASNHNHKNNIRQSTNRQNERAAPANKQNGVVKKNSNGNKPGNKSNNATNRQSANPGTPKLNPGSSVRGTNVKNMKMPNKNPMLSKKNSNSQCARSHARAQQQNRLFVPQSRSAGNDAEMKKAKTAGDGVRGRPVLANRRDGRAHSQIARQPTKIGSSSLRLYE